MTGKLWSSHRTAITPSRDFYFVAFGDIKEFAYSFLVMALAQMEHDGGRAFGITERVNFKTGLAYVAQHLRQILFGDWRDAQMDSFVAVSPSDEVHGLQADNGHQRCSDGYCVHAGSACKADGCCDPKSGGGRDSAYYILLENYDAGADETYA